MNIFTYFNLRNRAEDKNTVVSKLSDDTIHAAWHGGSFTIQETVETKPHFKRTFGYKIILNGLQSEEINTKSIFDLPVYIWAILQSKLVEQKQKA
ncbi:MAG: hypothetical protein FWE50_02400 [Alphaproteobacteria bacterium]|nr:hypothetical protein [Alphaproteobacteria bacterium]